MTLPYSVLHNQSTLIIQSLSSSADIADACWCGGDVDWWRAGDADDARDDDDDAERDRARSLALSLISLSDDILARVFESAAFSLW